MKNIKIATLAVLVVAALILTVGCSGETAKEDPTATTTTTAAETEITAFKAGTWDNDGNIYTFEADGKSGNVEYADGMGGVPFEYEIGEGSTIIFHMGSIDDNTPGTVDFADEDNATIILESGSSIVLKYVGEAPVTTFKAGNWDNDGNIYTFEADGKSGSIEYADGMGGVPFEYEINADGSAVFHMGSVDDETKATVKFADENNATITWADGNAVELTFAE